MKFLFKKDFIDLCNKHDINWLKIEQNAMMDLSFMLEDKNSDKANKEFETLLAKYGYSR